MLLLVSLLLPVSPSLHSTSFFDVLNGTDPTNPNNLHFKAAVGERLVVAHAELIDLDKDTNVTKDAAYLVQGFKCWCPMEELSRKP